MNHDRDQPVGGWPTNPFWLAPIDDCRLEKSLEEWEGDESLGPLCTGRMRFETVPVTPVHVVGQRSVQGRDKEQKIDRSRFYRENGEPVIPGASLRGMARHLIEAFTSARMEVVIKGSSDCHNPVEAIPRRPGKLDLATFLFGYVEQKPKRDKDEVRAQRGRLTFDDIHLGRVLLRDVEQPDTKGKSLYGGPTLEDDEGNRGKAGRTGWYLNASSHFAGRKFYFHQSPESVRAALKNNRLLYWYPAECWMPGSPGAVLTIGFDRVPLDAIMLVAAVLGDPQLGFKIGAGKPFGLGSVRFDLVTLEYRKIRDGLVALRELEKDAEGRPRVADAEYWINDERSPFRGRMCSVECYKRLRHLLSLDEAGYLSSRHGTRALLYPNPIHKKASKDRARREGRASHLDVYQRLSASWNRLDEIAAMPEDET